MFRLLAGFVSKRHHNAQGIIANRRRSSGAKFAAIRSYASIVLSVFVALSPLAMVAPANAAQGSIAFTITTGPGPSAVGQLVGILVQSAVVPGTGAVPSGQMQLWDGVVEIGQVSLQASSSPNESYAFFTHTFTTAAVHSLQAIYLGDSNYISSVSANFPQTVNATATGPGTNWSTITSTVLAASQTYSDLNGNYPYAEPVSPSTGVQSLTPNYFTIAVPTGTISYSLDGSLQATTAVNPNPPTPWFGFASGITLPPTTLGTHTIVGAYSGASSFPNWTFSPSSGSVSYNVVASPTSTTVSASATGNQDSVSVTVQPSYINDFGNPTAGCSQLPITGSVNILDNNAVIQTIPLVDSTQGNGSFLCHLARTASPDIITLPPGTNNITTQYNADANSNGKFLTSSSTAQVVNVVADTTPPVVTGTPTTSPDAAGWYNNNVTINWSATDSDSTPTTPSPTIASTEGTNTYTSAQSCDTVNNLCATGSLVLKIDKTAPTITAQATKADHTAYIPGTWTNQTVTVQYSCQDNPVGGSGLGSPCPSPNVISSDTPANGTNVTASVPDNAGNIGTSTINVKVDKTAPTITASATTADHNAYLPGTWTNQTVTVHYTCTDSLSGVVTCPGDQVISTDTSPSGQNVPGTSSTDNAGNTSVPTPPINVKVDKTAPTLTRTLLDSITLLPYAPNIWTSNSVDVNYFCQDNGSGLASTCPANQVVSDPGTVLPALTLFDNAGNSTTVGPANLEVDQIPPTITASATTADSQPYVSGTWTNQTVTVHFTCGDVGSGVNSCSVDQVVSTDTSATGQNVSGIATDVAGNSTTSNVINVQVDKTAPMFSRQLTDSLTSLPYIAGTTSVDPINVTYTCQDTGSGLAAACPAMQTIGAPGATLSAVTIYDKAGNASTVGPANVVVQAIQTVAFTTAAPTNAFVGGPGYSPSASATSNLPAAITVDPAAASVCSLTGGDVTFQNTGTCILDANQAGDASYSAAPQVVQSFTVNPASQTITFTSTVPANAIVGGPSYTPVASATSNLPVDIAVDVSSSAVCSMTGGVVSFQSTGTCTLDANQSGNANVSAATPVQQSFLVNAANQTVSFTSVAPSNAVVGGPVYSATASATSNLPAAVTVDASSASVCAINSGNVTFQNAGTCTLDANQGGDANNNPAPQAQQSFAVGQASQTVSFTSVAPTNAVVGGPMYSPTASATSGLPASITVDASSASVCSLSSGNVSFQNAGTCSLDANQAGDANNNAAPQVQQSFAVSQASQTVTFTSVAPTNAVVGGAVYSPTASATSNLPAAITVDASSAQVCAITNGNVSFQNAGTCTLDANQGGDANYSAAQQVQQSVTVNQASQTVTFTSNAPANAIVGGPTYTPTASSTSNLPVVIVVDVSSSTVCSISGGDVSFHTTGICTLDANQVGNANYSPATPAQQWFLVNAANQTVSFTSVAPTNAVVGGPVYSPTASATSGLPAAVTVDASSASVCFITNGNVSFQNAGTCVLDANQGGDPNNNPATQVQQSFQVGQASQSVAFTSVAPTPFVGGPIYSPSASATSGLPVAITVDASSASVCSITNGNVSFQSAGTCTLDANQGGDANHNAATQVQQSFQVNQATQIVSFTSVVPTNAVVGGPVYSPTASATSNLPAAITVDASTASVCAIGGGNVSFLNAGTCVLDANQGGNANFSAAPQVQQSVTVNKASQSVAFTSIAPTNAVVGGTYGATAVATSNLPATIAVDGASVSVCSINGATVSFLAAGTCKLDANQNGNSNFNAAPQAQQSFTVNAASQSLSFTSTAPTNAVVGGPTYSPTVTATSGLLASLTIDASATGVCSLSGGNVSFQSAGVCKIDANQAGNATYRAAPQVQQSFTVNKGSQTVAFTTSAPSNAVVAGTVYSPTAVATSHLTATITVDASASSVCAINAGNVSFLTAGTCVLDANQAGNANYSAAPQVQQSFTVNQKPVFVVSTPPTTGTVGQTYTYVFAASGSPAPTYSLSSGSPSWLSINPSTGQLSGTPPTGTTSFTYSVVATNSAGAATAGPYTVTVSTLVTSTKADISIVLTCTATTLLNGSVTCSAKVTNSGPATAHNVYAVVFLPSALSNVSLSTGGKLVMHTAVWNVATLASGASTTFTISAKAVTRGTATVSALAFSSNPDPALSNNVAKSLIQIN